MAAQQPEEDGTGLVFARARVSSIAASDPDVLSLSKDAEAVLTKAAELFVAELGRMAVENRQKSGAKQVEYSHVDIVPQTISGAEALARLEEQRQEQQAGDKAGG